MTASDRPFADIAPPLLPDPPVPNSAPVVSRVALGYSPIVRTAHGKLSDRAILLDLLASRGDRVLELLRPPFGKFGDLPAVANDQPGVKPGEKFPPRGFRDARVTADTQFDMRMPPYTRDSDATPLSVTHRQYQMITRLIDLLKKKNGPANSRGGNAGGDATE